ncbi:hypothetical protein HanRHA438_Chr09g0380611 [Helianthus annuus]|nr:hypothetical protein HanRHA438_Chr09g0380611 [Helianthus annuus]
MVAPGRYEYPMEAQNAFDPFAYRTPPIQSPRENVERLLPIYDDNETEDVVPETQNLDDDEDVRDASDPKGKGGQMERQSWPKKEARLSQSLGSLFYKHKERKSTKIRQFLGKSSRALQHEGWQYTNHSSSTFKMDTYVD